MPRKSSRCTPANSAVSSRRRGSVGSAAARDLATSAAPSGPSPRPAIVLLMCFTEAFPQFVSAVCFEVSPWKVRCGVLE